MKYYVCPAIGTGAETDMFRPKVASYLCDFAAIYAKPDEQTVLVAVSATDEIFAEIPADTESLYLGDNMDEVVTTEEFNRVVPSGEVRIYV